MGRPMQSIESLRSLVATRLPALANVRRISDIELTDPVRVRMIDEEPKRLRLAALVSKAEKALELFVATGARADEAARAQQLVSQLRRRLAALTCSTVSGGSHYLRPRVGVGGEVWLPKA